jgi:regulatory protein YycI of two-component signal transduction system YycFG
MNWGKGLTIFIVAFMITMLGMVYVAFRQSNEMIEDNYYERELKYQKIIDGKNELLIYNNFSFISEANGIIKISLPSELRSKIDEGQVQFIKLDKESLDKTYRITQLNVNRLVYPRSDFAQGMYLIKISWKNNNKFYFREFDYSMK